MFYYNQVDSSPNPRKANPGNTTKSSLYLSLYAAVEGKGAECAFPGTEKSWKIKSNDSSQDIVAKFVIYASLHPEITTVSGTTRQIMRSEERGSRNGQLSANTASTRWLYIEDHLD